MTSRTPVGRGRAREAELVKGPGGRNLCRCGCGREVEGRRRTFFEDACVERFKLRGLYQGEFSLRVLRRDGYRCQLCGASATEADHIVPLVEGGPHTLENGRALCHACHTKVTGLLRKRLAIRRFESKGLADPDWLRRQVQRLQETPMEAKNGK